MSKPEPPKKQMWSRAFQGRNVHAWVRQPDGGTLVWKALCDSTKVFDILSVGLNVARCRKCERLLSR